MLMNNSKFPNIDCIVFMVFLFKIVKFNIL